MVYTARYLKLEKLQIWIHPYLVIIQMHNRIFNIYLVNTSYNLWLNCGWIPTQVMMLGLTLVTYDPMKSRSGM